MKTTTDRLPAYKVYGTIEFMVDGTMQMLTIYQNLELRKRATKITCFARLKT